MQDTSRLDQALGRAVTFLRAATSPTMSHWANELARIRGALRDPASRGTALVDLDNCFGGMGSLNDITFHPLNENVTLGQDSALLNAQLKRLLDEVFRELRLLGASLWTRLHWRWMELVHRKGPPRVLKAFARRGAA